MSLAVGALAAAVASLLYNAGLLLQADASRREPVETALSPNLLVRLVRRRRWLAGSAIAGLGWPLHAFALTRAPLTVVQPLLAIGLVVPLAFGKRMLGDHLRRSDLANLVSLVGGISLLVALAPPRTARTGIGFWLAVALAALAVLLVSAQLLAAEARGRRGLFLMLAAGIGFALSSIVTKLLADALSHGKLVETTIWLVVTAAAGGLGVHAEMSALQVSVVSTVSAVVLAIETIVPVALSPFLFGEIGSTSTLSIGLRALALAFTLTSAIALTRNRSVVEALAEP